MTYGYENQERLTQDEQQEPVLKRRSIKREVRAAEDKREAVVFRNREAVV